MSRSFSHTPLTGELVDIVRSSQFISPRLKSPPRNKVEFGLFLVRLEIYSLVISQAHLMVELSADLVVGKRTRHIGDYNFEG